MDCVPAIEASSAAREGERTDVWARCPSAVGTTAANSGTPQASRFPLTCTSTGALLAPTHPVLV